MAFQWHSNEILTAFSQHFYVIRGGFEHVPNQNDELFIGILASFWWLETRYFGACGDFFSDNLGSCQQKAPQANSFRSENPFYLWNAVEGHHKNRHFQQFFGFFLVSRFLGRRRPKFEIFRPLRCLKRPKKSCSEKRCSVRPELPEFKSIKNDILFIGKSQNH